METKQTFEPGPELLVVKRSDGPRKPTLIVVPDTVKKPESWAEVVLVNAQCTRGFKPGDLLLIDPMTKGVPFQLNGQDVYMMQESAALGVMREEQVATPILVEGAVH